MSEGEPARPWLRLTLAALVFGVASAATFAPILREGPERVVAVRPADGGFAITRAADAAYQAWLVARHARTWTSQPHRLFDTEHCAPAERTLVYGIPMLTQGLLAAPVSLLTREPVLVYNVSILLLTLISAFAMYALVVRWSGLAAAGIVAGLLFAFHPLRLGGFTHPSVWDISWTVLAIFFAERLLAEGRWRDAVGLAAVVALQIGASFYPLLAATFLTPPLLVWLVRRHGLRRVRPAQLGLVAGTTLAAAAAVLLPYLGAESDQGAFIRTSFHYLSWGAVADPGTRFFPGWTLLVLVAVSAVAGSRRAAPGIGGDPRIPLALGALLVALIAAGSNNAPLPNLHSALATLVPGLDAVRGIVRLTAGAQLALALLAGLGAGVLLRAAGRWQHVAAAALVCLVGFDLLRAPALGLERGYAWRLEEIRPADETIDFFDELERRGSRGALLELPEPPIVGAPRYILLSAYHQRRTSACFGSYRPPGRDALAALVSKLPSPAAIEALAAEGFTTVVVHPSRDVTAGRLRLALDAAAIHDPRIVPLHETPARAAYTFRPQTHSR